MARPILNAARTITLLAAAFCLTCGTASSTAPKYPKRGPGCELNVYHTAVPDVPAWDDLGIAEAGCHVSLSLSQCLQNLKAEACRMGGDLLYNVPLQPLRPQDQVMLFRGQVAHTRKGVPERHDRHKDDDGDDENKNTANKVEEPEPEAPPPASPEEAAQPVVPLTGPAAPKGP
jgi:hypothetical protein